MERVITIQEAVVLKSGHSKRGPWTLSAVKDENGQGYTTFKNELRELAQGNIGATAKILFTENDGKVNLEGLEILSKASESPSNGTELSALQKTQLALDATTEHLNDRERRIMRQSAAKVAVELLKLEDPEHQTFENLAEITNRLVSFFETGKDDVAIGIPFGE